MHKKQLALASPHRVVADCCGLRPSAGFSYREQSKAFQVIPPALQAPLRVFEAVSAHPVSIARVATNMKVCEEGLHTLQTACSCIRNFGPIAYSQSVYRRVVAGCDHLLASAIARNQSPFGCTRQHCQGHCAKTTPIRLIPSASLGPLPP